MFVFLCSILHMGFASCFLVFGGHLMVFDDRCVCCDLTEFVESPKQTVITLARNWFNCKYCTKLVQNFTSNCCAIFFFENNISGVIILKW